jgi:hypothetical protein
MEFIALNQNVEPPVVPIVLVAEEVETFWFRNLIERTVLDEVEGFKGEELDIYETQAAKVLSFYVENNMFGPFGDPNNVNKQRDSETLKSELQSLSSYGLTEPFVQGVAQAVRSADNGNTTSPVRYALWDIANNSEKFSDADLALYADLTQRIMLLLVERGVDADFSGIIAQLNYDLASYDHVKGDNVFEDAVFNQRNVNALKAAGVLATQLKKSYGNPQQPDVQLGGRH